jgi:hypothetical protein
MPLKEDSEKRYVGEKDKSKGVTTIAKAIILPQVGCVIIFLVVACITERRKLLSDPLNFSALNVTFEVVRYKIYSNNLQNFCVKFCWRCYIVTIVWASNFQDRILLTTNTELVFLARTSFFI